MSAFTCAILAPCAILAKMALANPKSIQVHLTTGKGVDIEWKDGHRTHYAFQWLRDACPCATCDDERKQSDRKPGEPVPQPASLLPLYKEPPRPNEVQSVGKYAICFQWNDGHGSGIYSWDYLREQCQCGECRHPEPHPSQPESVKEDA
ncbi:MAG TPA: DUF971 domain-containing protein [Candidatus Angelobacter sp.]|nr:DUF971 domain-containing protein [Candidatus Angelobacter sp.]